MMTMEILRDAFGWGALINYISLLLWFCVFRYAHGWLYHLHNRLFGTSIPVALFNAMHYAGMGLYKLILIAFGLVPFIALHIAG